VFCRCCGSLGTSYHRRNGEGEQEGKCSSSIFLRIDFLATELTRGELKSGVRVGERGVCTLGTGSDQSSPFF
jgi:hypothetical protein